MQNMCYLICLFIYLMLVLKYNPFEQAYLNMLEKATTFALIITVICMHFLLSASISYNVRFFLSLILFISNLITCLMILYFLIRESFKFIRTFFKSSKKDNNDKTKKKIY